MAFTQAVCLLASIALVAATSTGLNYGPAQLIPTSVNGYNDPEIADPCDLGPSFWCQPGTNNLQKCQVQWQQYVGACGYTSGLCPVFANMGDFCANYTKGQLGNAITLNGGITNVTPGKFGWILVSLYWPPSDCPANGTTGGFCSNYTAKGQPASSVMQLHGMWPDFGSQYGVYGTPPLPTFPSYSQAYEGWSQYCSADINAGPLGYNYSSCHVNNAANACPGSTITSQSALDLCIAKQGTPAQCVVPAAVTTALKDTFVQYAAGYFNPDFLLHEFNKHGSCYGGELTQNKTAFFETATNKAKSLQYNKAVKLVQRSRGLSIPFSRLQKAMNGKAIAQCNRDCSLSELWFCYGKTANGYPTDELIPCGPGHLVGDTCNPATGGKCNKVIIYDYTIGTYIKA